MKHILPFLFFLLVSQLVFASINPSGTFISNADTTIRLPLGGNSWANKEAGDQFITEKGITNWSDKGIMFQTFFRINRPGSIHLKLHAKSNGASKLNITIGHQTRQVNIHGTAWQVYDVGDWIIKDTGYIAIGLQGINATANYFPAIDEYELSGTAINTNTAYVKTSKDNFFYWGRRGPSVHLKYLLPDTGQVKWFYNEVTVPVGQDVIGSYFMATGFGEGYFGIQVNSATERRILFSVWSPFATDDPKSIPADQRIVLLKKGDGVTTGEFGDEGSGGQSFLRYHWQAGHTYRFLLKALPDDENNTTYTAYFFAPEKNTWQLIASFKRPHTHTYLKGLHSFLENFEPSQGNKERKVLFANQWVQDVHGNWIELTKAMFTYDNTAAKGYRMDYQGGVNDNAFYLKNCGFFKNYTTYKTIFTRHATGTRPQIDLDKLP